jgi:hypothetical protein
MIVFGLIIKLQVKISIIHSTARLKQVLFERMAILKSHPTMKFTEIEH